MPRQLIFDLPARPALGRADFFVSSANRAAVAAITDWPAWPMGKLVLTGPEGAGKTHLAHVWATEADAVFVLAGSRPMLSPGAHVIVEDADRMGGDPAKERALFHLHNDVLSHGGRLLLTGRTPPSHWSIGLPDLASRLQGALSVGIAPPDDLLLAAVLFKQFADRQILAPESLIRWLLRRMPRSFAAASELVARLDTEALAEGQPVNRTIAQRILDSLSDDLA